jgi:hypothetical protein
MILAHYETRCRLCSKMIVPGTPIVPYGDDPFSDDAEYWVHLRCPVVRREPVLATITEITIVENSGY